MDTFTDRILLFNSTQCRSSLNQGRQMRLSLSHMRAHTRTHTNTNTHTICPEFGGKRGNEDGDPENRYLAHVAQMAAHIFFTQMKVSIN